MGERKVMKDLGFNEPVTITLPAHNWHGIMTAYAGTKWESADLDFLCEKIIEQLVDPVFLKEREAAAAEHRDKHQQIFQAMFTGRPPGLDDNDPRKETE